MADERKVALENLIWFRVPVLAGVQALRDFPWDSDSELVVLTRLHCQRLVVAFHAGALGRDDCKLWAATLEGRDDVGLEPGYEMILKDFLLEIATPEVTRQLTLLSAEEWTSRLT